MSIFNGIKENDIVEIKFRDMKDVYHDLDSLKEYDDLYSLSYNMRAILHGGMFHVIRPPEQHPLNKKYYITIGNHLDNSDSWQVYEDIVDTIKTHSDVPSFTSKQHGFNIVRLNNQLIINGDPLKKWKKERQQQIRNNHFDDGKEDDDLDEFKEFIEKWLVDVATEEAMGELDEEKSDEQPSEK